MKTAKLQDYSNKPGAMAVLQQKEKENMEIKGHLSNLTVAISD
jgi:hypothetical protein